MISSGAPPATLGEGQAGLTRTILGEPRCFTSHPLVRGELADSSERNLTYGLESPARENEDFLDALHALKESVGSLSCVTNYMSRVAK